MKHLITLAVTFALCASFSTAQAQVPENARVKELNAYWLKVSHAVNTGDFTSYKSTCHKDGVLVSGIRSKAYPLADALKRWKQEFTDTKSGKIKASVTFRFSKRMGDKTTAHETGIFLYRQRKADGTQSNEYIHFEALLLKRGTWQVVMEYQKSVATKVEWDKLGKSIAYVAPVTSPPPVTQDDAECVHGQ